MQETKIEKRGGLYFSEFSVILNSSSKDKKGIAESR
jgi:hypothetical protein